MLVWNSMRSGKNIRGPRSGCENDRVNEWIEGIICNVKFVFLGVIFKV